MQKKEMIFLVEDNVGFALSTKKGLENELGFDVMHFDSGEKCSILSKKSGDYSGGHRARLLPRQHGCQGTKRRRNHV